MQFCIEFLHFENISYICEILNYVHPYMPKNKTQFIL